MEDGCGDVGVVGRYLAEALGAIVGCDADDADVAVGEGFEGFDSEAGRQGHYLMAAF